MIDFTSDLSQIRTCAAKIHSDMTGDWEDITEHHDLHTPEGTGIMKLIGSMSNKLLDLQVAVQALEDREIDLELIAELKAKLPKKADRR